MSTFRYRSHEISFDQLCSLDQSRFAVSVSLGLASSKTIVDLRKRRLHDHMDMFRDDVEVCIRRICAEILNERYSLLKE